MAGRADTNTPLRYAEIQIFPSQNRYEVSICSEGDIESLEDGVLELLSPHLPAVKELCSKGGNATCKLSPPGNSNAVAWFTKSTLSRFLQIVRSSDVVHTTSSIKDEMLQLEEARKFHLSLQQPKVEKASADSSKNELLRAMDLRLTALRTELTNAFCKAASAICSSKDINSLVNFSQHFGGVNLRDGLHKLSQLNEERKGNDVEKNNHSITGNLRNDVTKLRGDVQTLTRIASDTHVKYNVSPAKAAQAERRNGSESDESSGPSDDDRGSAERSRTLIRSASPRRSASPMRRVQIGRGGSRRAAALTIKSIGYIPASVKNLPYKDGTGSEEEEEEEEKSQQPIKRTETHVRRMSVQDAINLFENKQKDKPEDNPQLRKSMSSLSATASKSVLRRWSSGMGETSGQSEQEHERDIADTPHDPESYNRQRSSDEDKPMQTVPTSQESKEIPEDHVSSERYEKSDSDPIDIEEDTTASKEEDDTKKSAATTEWNRVKEAELNQMLMQMMESKPAKYTKTQQSRKQSLPSGQRGGFYDHYKEKRDEKLRGENTKIKAEKEAQFKAMQQILDERKAEMSSKNTKGVEKKPVVRKSLKPLKNSSPQPKPVKEAAKATLPKKASPRTSPLPPTRKSWPSTPPARAAAISPAKTPAANSSTSTTPTRRKTPQPTSLPRIAPKAEKPQPVQRSVKEPLVENGKNSKTLKTAPKKNSTSTKVKKVTTEECSEVVVPTKTGLYSKAARKSAVVPVEPKPFLRKGSRANPTVTKKNSSQPEEPQKSNEQIAESREDDVVPAVTEEEAVIENHRDSNLTAVDSADPINIHEESSGTENSDSVLTEDHSDLVKESIEDSPTEIQAEEESIISPSAWVEREAAPPKQGSSATGSTSPRVRHSLSQMLLEETNEPDIVEWGNAENPPAILYQKDAPKGLKRLLKFARKNKGEANNSGFSSPSVFSEGEDDSDGFMKKGAVSSKNHEARELNSAQSGIGKFHSRSNLQESDLGGVSTAKGTRSFFSLSAFRGSAK